MKNKNHRCLVPLPNLRKCWSFRGLDNVEYGIYVLIIINNILFYYIGLSEGHGFYFESNSFHRISLTELTIQENLIEGFIPYIETMKSIIIHNGENDQSLLDTVLNKIACLINSKLMLKFSDSYMKFNFNKMKILSINLEVQGIILRNLR